MLWGLRRLLPSRRPRLDSDIFYRLKELNILKPFRGNKGRFNCSETHQNCIPVRITARSSNKPRLLPPQHTNNSTKLPVLKSPNVNKVSLPRNLTYVKKVTPSLLKCALMNCQSVSCKKKQAYIQNVIMEEPLDCLVMTETWLSDKDEYSRPILGRLVPDNWAILHVQRKSRGGGVGFLNFSAKLDTSLKFTSFESQTVLMTAASVTFQFIVIYRVHQTIKTKF